MKPVYVKPSMHTGFNQEKNKKGPKFKVGDHVKLSKYKNENIFAKDYVPNQSEEVFVIKKVKNTVLRMLLAILEAKKFFERFMKKNFKKTKIIYDRKSN